MAGLISRHGRSKGLPKRFNYLKVANVERIHEDRTTRGINYHKTMLEMKKARNLGSELGKLHGLVYKRERGLKVSAYHKYVPRISRNDMLRFEKLFDLRLKILNARKKAIEFDTKLSMTPGQRKARFVDLHPGSGRKTHVGSDRPWPLSKIVDKRVDKTAYPKTTIYGENGEALFTAMNEEGYRKARDHYNAMADSYMGDFSNAEYARLESIVGPELEKMSKAVKGKEDPSK